MAISIYEPRDAHRVLSEVYNKVMAQVKDALIEYGGECVLETPVPMFEGAELHNVVRVYIEDDDMYYEDDEGEEDEITTVADITGMCDVWANIINN